MGHIDPLETAAWNTLVSGRKRWVVFPPSEESPQFVYDNEHDELEDMADDDISDSASHWMHYRYGRSRSSCQLTYYDFIQHPGETVYIPNGWWHNVVNLEFAIALTENFVCEHNFDLSFAAMC